MTVWTHRNPYRSVNLNGLFGRQVSLKGSQLIPISSRFGNPTFGVVSVAGHVNRVVGHRQGVEISFAFDFVSWGKIHGRVCFAGLDRWFPDGRNGECIKLLLAIRRASASDDQRVGVQKGNP